VGTSGKYLVVSGRQADGTWRYAIDTWNFEETAPAPS
jgi:hypothetical protein